MLCRWSMRWRSAALASLCTVHTLVVGWVAWYCAESIWSSAPFGVSATPLPPLAFHAAWTAGAVFLLAIGPAIGSGALQGPWVGGNPTLGLPIGHLARVVRAWIESALSLTIIALAPLPLYLALFAMGGVTVSQLSGPVVWQAGAIAGGALTGIGCALWRRRPGWPTGVSHA
jgi:hypothetical protein